MNEGGTGKIEQVVNHSGDNSWVGKLTWLFRLPSYLTIFIVTFISARTRASTISSDPTYLCICHYFTITAQINNWKAALPGF